MGWSSEGGREEQVEEEKGEWDEESTYHYLCSISNLPVQRLKIQAGGDDWLVRLKNGKVSERCIHDRWV